MKIRRKVEKAEIVLIQPVTGPWDEMSIRFPESLLAVAALPVSKGYRVKLIDRRVISNFRQELADAVGPETVVFGVTAITGEQIGHALKTIDYLKEHYPHVPVCVGGVHATLLPEQTAAHPHIDYVVVGDGDIVFCALFERLRDRRPVDDLEGIVYKTPSGTIRSNPNKVILDLDALPPLPYELIDLDNYGVFHASAGSRSATLHTSRGCPYRCKFCSGPVINHGVWRGLSAERVLEKVDLLYAKYGYGLIYFQDDYFPGSKKRFIEILRGLKRYNRKLLWSTLGIRADILSELNDEEWELLHDSGCHSLEIGIESGNERIIRYINKGETLEQMRTVNQRLARYNIKVKYTLIIGFPGETKEEIADTVQFASELEESNPHAYCLIFNFLPIIGTPFYNEALAHGFTAPASLEAWANMDFDGWMNKYTYMHARRFVRKLELITFASYFHNQNVYYKFSGSHLLRLCFKLYHPIARWRFKHRYFGCPFELYLKNWLLKIRYGAMIISNN
ncbi:MAG: radical SAM protein [Nitrospirota bacterium]